MHKSYLSLFVAVVTLITTACSGVAEDTSITKNSMPWHNSDDMQPSDIPDFEGDPSSESKANVIARVEAYLNGLTTMASPFIQIAPNGTLSDGTFYLARPGKLRWEYNPPVPILIVANKGLVTYYDAELEQISHTSVDSTPLAFLLDKHIDLTSGDIQLTDIHYNRSVIEVTLQQKGEEENGSIVLTFSDTPLELKKVSLVRAGSKTVITFMEAVYSQSLDKSLFIVKDPRLFRQKKN